MTRNLKVLGLALFAVFALSAVAASAASAANDNFTSEKGTTILTGNQVGSPAQNVFGTKSSSLEVTCPNAVFGPTTVTGVSVASVTTHPEYGGCTAGVFGEAPVDTAGCNYVLTGETLATKDTNGVSNGEESTVRVDCTGTNAITITGFGCTIKISNTGNQNLLGLRYDNEGSGSARDVLATVTVDNITYTSSGLSCGLVKVKPAGTDGFLTERVTVKGFEDAAENKEGKQIGILVD